MRFGVFYVTPLPGIIHIFSKGLSLAGRLSSGLFARNQTEFRSDHSGSDQPLKSLFLTLSLTLLCKLFYFLILESKWFRASLLMQVLFELCCTHYKPSF